MADDSIDLFELYVRDIKRHKLLTKDEEIALAKRLESGDKSAKQEMILANLRLVVFWAERFRHQGLELLDLIQEGFFGLLRAVELFDWRRGYKFSTYASRWIRQAIGLGIEKSGRAIRVPTHHRGISMKLYKAKRAFTADAGRNPTKDELSKLTGVGKKRISYILEGPRVCFSLDEPIGLIDGSPITLLHVLAAEDTEELLRRVEDDEFIERCLRLLNDWELDVIAKRFGFGDWEPLSLEDLADTTSSSRETVRKLIIAILEKIKANNDVEVLTGP